VFSSSAVIDRKEVIHSVTRDSAMTESQGEGRRRSSSLLCWWYWCIL